MFKFVYLLILSILCLFCVCEIDSNSPIFVGGLFETIGSSQNLHSFGEYYPDSGDWFNVKDSAIMSTGTADAITVIESGREKGSIVVGGVFNYLNHTSNTISFGNIAYYNKSNVIEINTSKCTDINPCYSIVVAGRFDACIQGQGNTAVSYPGGLAFYDLVQDYWYKPVNLSLPLDILISGVTFSGDFGYLYVIGDYFNSTTSTGYVFRSNIYLSDTVGELSYLDWKEVVRTSLGRDGIFNTIMPSSDDSFYIGGIFDSLTAVDNEYKFLSNIAFFNGTDFSGLAGGTNGEVISSTYISHTNPPVLYITGSFSSVGDSMLSANYIAAWNTTDWTALNGEVILNTQYTTILGGPLLEIGSWDTNIIIGGAIEKVGNLVVNNIAQYDGYNWSSLGDDSDFTHYRMFPFDVDPTGNIYFASQSLQNTFFEDIIINGYPLVENLMVHYNSSDSTWNNFVYNELLLDGIVFDMEFYNETTLIIGGGFRKAGNITNLNNLVLLDYPNMNWSPFDGGVFGIVTSIVVAKDDIYIGGVFQYTDNSTKYATVAKYNHNTGWDNVGSGISKADPNEFSGRPIVYDLVLSSDSKKIYAGGSFQMLLDVYGNLENITSLVAWDIENNQWIAVQNEINGIICDLEIDKNLLYLGGKYTLNSTYNLGLLKINDGSNMGEWQDIVNPCSTAYSECGSQIILSLGVNPNVPYGNETGSPIYIGGIFDTIGGNIMNGLARLVNDQWVAFGSGVTGTKYPFVISLELTYDYSTLYIGGAFTSANSIPVSDIVAWSLSSLSFSSLSPIEGWQGVILDILPVSINFTSSESSKESKYS